MPLPPVAAGSVRSVIAVFCVRLWLAMEALSANAGAESASAATAMVKVSVSSSVEAELSSPSDTV